jgi:hypothetical protein
MQADAEARAYDALLEHARVDDLAAVAHAVMQSAEQGRRAEAGFEHAARFAAERSLTREDAATPFGNALDILTRGPEDEAQRALACALAAHALRVHAPRDRDDEDRRATSLLWLATHTAFDATSLIDVALGDAATTMWDALAERIRRIDAGTAPSLGRGEGLVAAIALARSSAPAAAKLAAALAGEVRDDKTAFVLGEADDGGPSEVAGELAPCPRGPFAVAILGVTGISFVIHALRLFGRLGLGYRRPAHVGVAVDGGVRVQWHTEVLGRTVREGDVLIPHGGLAAVRREVRYPSLALYAGLLALAAGTYIGVWAFVDGLRASSPSLLGAGVAIVALGLAVDFALSSVVPGLRGRCRVVLTPRAGPTLCVGRIDRSSADALLARIARRASR